MNGNPAKPDSRGNGGYKCLCPACGSRMRIDSRSTECITTRIMFAQCQDFFCGATYLGKLVFTHELTPSKLENPILRLPSAADEREAARQRYKAARARKATA